MKQHKHHTSLSHNGRVDAAVRAYCTEQEVTLKQAEENILRNDINLILEASTASDAEQDVYRVRMDDDTVREIYGETGLDEGTIQKVMDVLKRQNG